MGVQVIARGQTVCAKLIGDIDHHSAREMRCLIDVAVRENDAKELILDFSGVTFMDSSGIGLVMGRYKVMTEREGRLTIARLPGYIRKVMRVAGINRLARIAEDYELPAEEAQEVVKIETTN
ncbi:MAG: anti-sigma factor antagonist [Ruminococcus sp.]|nr:anti-sigma factor antagonist [Ruminococcus sp.]